MAAQDDFQPPDDLISPPDDLVDTGGYDARPTASAYPKGMMEPGGLNPRDAGSNWSTHEVGEDGIHKTIVLPKKPGDRPANDETGFLGDAVERWQKDRSQMFGVFEDEDSAKAFVNAAQKPPREVGPPSDLIEPPPDLVDTGPSAAPAPPAAPGYQPPNVMDVFDPMHLLSKIPGAKTVTNYLTGTTPGMPGVGQAILRGAGRAWEESGQAGPAMRGEPTPVLPQEGPEAGPLLSMETLRHPGNIPAQIAYGMAKASPELAGAILGGTIGGRAAGIPGAITGAGVGGGGMAYMQSIGQEFARQLQATPNDPDGAYERAWHLSGVDAAGSGIGWAAFGLNPFKSEIKNLLLQALVVQPDVAGVTRAARNLAEGKPAGEGVPEAMAEAAAVQTPVMLAGHAIVRGLRGRPGAAPGAEVPPEPPAAEPGAPPATIAAPPGIPPGTPPEAAPSPPTAPAAAAPTFSPGTEISVPGKRGQPRRAIIVGGFSGGKFTIVKFADGTTRDYKTEDLQAVAGPPQPQPPPRAAAEEPPPVAETEPEEAPPSDLVEAPGREPGEDVVPPEELAAALEPPKPPRATKPTVPMPPPTPEAQEHDVKATTQTNAAPTDGQKEAGNYAKAPINFQGIPIRVETAKGAVREGPKDEHGVPAWTNVNPLAHYGYAVGTTGADSKRGKKEGLDVYVGPNTKAPNAYVVDQHDPKTGEFDETKTILGVDTPEQAAAVYDAGFSDKSGPARRKTMVQMPVGEWKTWSKTPAAKEAITGQGIGRNVTPPVPVTRETVPAAAPESKPAVVYVPKREGEPTWTQIGVNQDGNPVFEDQRGVRSYTAKGVRTTEPVAILPSRSGMRFGITRPAAVEFEPITAEAPAATEQAKPKAGADALADRVAGALAADTKPIDSKALQKMAEESYGGTLASGAIPRGDMYDATELGVNRYLRQYPATGGHGPFSPAVDADNAIARAGFLEALKNRLPTQTVRAGEKETHQQFSTPPDYAYAATWVANLRPTDVVLEPSAGTGSFVAPALNAGVRQVHANDLSDRRADMLRSLNPTNVTTENAEHIHAILPKDVRPTIVLMNPPFSAAATRMAGKKVLDVGAKHLEEALKRLEPGGRLVAIVGKGMNPEAATFRDFWKRIGSQYDVRANIGVDGDIYRKYGTTFPTRLIVIDKVPPSGRAPVVLDNVKDAKGIIEALSEVQRDRPIPPAVEQYGPQPSSAPVAPGGEGAVQPGAPVPHATGVLGLGEGRPTPVGGLPGGAARPSQPPVGGEGQRGAGAGAGVPVAPIEPGRPVTSGTIPDLGEGAPGSAGSVGSGGGGAGDGVQPDGSGERSDPGVTEPPPTVSATEESMAPDVHDAPITDAVYEPYTPQRARVPGAKPHPGALVQSAAMASVLPPAPRHALSLPKKLIEKGALSDAQLEAIIYAGYAHSEMIPETSKLPERRRGFFIGDGTGVGKGREVSGIILDNWERGKRKHIWVSEKRALINDARRDWSGISGNPKDVVDHGSTKAGDAIPHKQGILFTTYDTLKSGQKGKPDEQVIADLRSRLARLGTDASEETESARPALEEELRKAELGTGGKTRVQQIIDWVGPDFDGVIAFDEAHNLGNSFDSKGNRGMKKAAAKALAGVELQNSLPKARVVYVSATGATEVANLAYADRLGLWGRGTAFASRDDFLAKVSQGGIAAMELVARDMKALGYYIARNLSYEGVEYDRLEHPLTPDQRLIYDKLADAWQMVLRNFNAAMEAAGISGETKADGSPGKTLNAQAKSAILSQFWGGHQRFFNQVITSMQMPSVLKAVEKDIAEGRQAVLQLVNTNEAAQERALAKVSAEEDSEALEDLDMSPRDQLLQLVANAYPTQRFEEYVDESGNVRSRPVLDEKGNPVRDPDLVAARERLLDELGSIRVPDGPLEMLLNHFGTEKVAEVTGRKQRVVRAADPKTGQMRTIVEKRPGQANVAEANAFQEAKKPILVFSEAGGTGRSYHADINSASAGARRSHYLVQAGWRADKAVQGFGRTHRTNQASAPIFHLVTTDLQGQKRFVSSIARRLGQLGALTKGERRTGNQGLFGLRDNLESDEAKTALRGFFNDVIDGNIEGLGVSTLENQMGLKLIEPTTGRPLKDPPPMTQFLNRLLSLRTDTQNQVFNEFSRRMDDVLDRAAAAGTLDTGVETYKADKIIKKADQVVYTDPHSGAETRHVQLEVQRRNHPQALDDVLRRYRQQGYVRSARSGKIFVIAEATPYTDKNGNIIEQKRLVGPLDYQFIDAHKLEDERYWQPITPMRIADEWGKQVAALPEFAVSDLHLITGAVLPIWDRLGGSPRIYRLQTDIGERMLGRVIPNDTVDATLTALGAERAKVSATPEQIVQRVMDGQTAKLANGWKIKRSLVSGEPRMELIGPDFAFLDQLRQDGVFTERISWTTRFFIPTGKEAPEVIERITRGRPVMQLSAEAKGPTGEEPQLEHGLPSAPGERPPVIKMGHGVYGEPVRAVTAKQRKLIEEVDKIAKRLVPTAPVRVARRLYAQRAGQKKLEDATGAAYQEGRARAMAWSLESPNAVGTVRHEAVHWLRRQGLITRDEWEKLSNAAIAENWAENHNIDARYPGIGPEDRIEESVAEEFAKWNRAPKSVPPWIARIFERIRQFLRQIAVATRRIFGKDATVDDIFTAMEAGKVGRRGEEAPADQLAAQFQRPEALPVDIEAGRNALDDMADAGAGGGDIGKKAETEAKGLPPTGGRPSKHLSGLFGSVERLYIFPRTLAATDWRSAKYWNANQVLDAEATRLMHKAAEGSKQYVALTQDQRKSLHAVEELARLKGVVLEDDGLPIVMRSDLGISPDDFRRMNSRQMAYALSLAGIPHEDTEGIIKRIKNGDPVTMRRALDQLNPPLAHSKFGDVIELDAQTTSAYHERRALMRGRWRDIMAATAKRLGWDGPPDSVEIGRAAAEEENQSRKKQLNNIAQLMDAMAEQERLGYVPFMRFGDYYLAVLPKSGKDKESLGGFPRSVEFRLVESKPSMGQVLRHGTTRRAGEIPPLAQEAIDDLRKRYPEEAYDIRHGYLAAAPDQLKQLDIPAIEKFLIALGQKDEEIFKPIVEELMAKMYEELKAGFRKHANNTPGWDADFARSTGSYMHWTSRHIANLLHGEELRRAKEQYIDTHPDKGTQQYWNRYEMDQHSTGAKMRALQRFGFYWELAGNPSSSAAIALHGPMVANFTLGIGLGASGTGTVAASRVLYPALGQVMAGIRADAEEGLHIDLANVKGITADERKGLERADRVGLLHSNATEELGAMRTRGSNTFQQNVTESVGISPEGWSRFLRIAGSNIAVVDRMNRTAIWLAAYRLAKKPGVIGKWAKTWGGNQLWQEMAARQGLTPENVADFMVDEAAFVWGRKNQPQMARMAPLVFQFRGFEMRYLSALWRNAHRMGWQGKRSFLMMLVGLGMLAGALGLPGADDALGFIENIWKSLTKKEGRTQGADPMIESDLYDMLEEAGFSKAGAEAVLRGPSRSVLGIDLSNRLGFGNVVGKNLDFEYNPAGVLGAVPGILYNMYGQVPDRLRNQQPLAAVGQMLPAAIRNPWEALVVYPNEGVRTRYQPPGQPPVLAPKDITVSAQAAKAMGFQPSAIARAYETRDFYRRLNEAVRAESEPRTGRQQRQQQKNQARTPEQRLPKQFRSTPSPYPQ